jgi:hypothetical protein
VKKILIVMASIALISAGVGSAQADQSTAGSATARPAPPTTTLSNGVAPVKKLTAKQRRSLKPVSARKAAKLNKIRAAAMRQQGPARTASASSPVYQGFYRLASPIYFYQYRNDYYSAGYYWIDYSRYFLDCSDYGGYGCVYTRTYHVYRYVYYSGAWHFYAGYGPGRF